MFGFFKKKDKTEVFWTWLSNNIQIFEKIESHDQNEKLNLILENLRNISDGLSIQISKESKGIRDLVISPDGNKEKFAIVTKIIEKAPQIKGWTFTAFRQPTEGNFTLKYEDMEFTPSEMFFYPKIEGNSLDLIIYTKNIKNHDFNIISYYGLMTIDNLLGEYDCVMKIRHYDFHDLNEAGDKITLKPLNELKIFVDNFHKAQQN